MALLSNGTYTNKINYLGGRDSSHSIGSSYNKNSVNSAILWGNEVTSTPPGKYQSAFYMPLRLGGLMCLLSGTSLVTTAISAIGVMSSHNEDPYSIKGEGEISNAYLAKGRNLMALLEGLGEISDAPITTRALLNCLIRIGATPSADDIVYALMDTPTGNVETSISLRQALRLLISIAAGKTTIDVGSPTVVKFKDTSGYIDRVTAQMDGSERTDVTLDLD
jgi:hypothetical protein